MSNASILTDSSFDPEAIEMLASALDDAWETVQRSGGTLSRPAYAGTIREVLAKRIIEAAQRGQSDAQTLREDAVRYLAANYKN
jgi:hypothetical protein